jgi:hypothetical protein
MIVPGGETADGRSARLASPLTRGALPGQITGHEVGNLQVVQVREGEVRVAANAELGQMDHRDIAAPAIDGIRPELAMARRTRQLSCPGLALGSAGILSP